MYDIKELTWEHHKNAERQAFVKTLMSGEIDPQYYAHYLYNQLACYSALEKEAQVNSLFRTTIGLQRAEHLYYDYKSLWNDLDNPPSLTESTQEYVKHIDTIKDDAEKLYAHIYVRHMGDLSGGQMIKKKTPGPNRYLTFKNRQVIDFGRIVKETVNSYLNVYEINVVSEARLCFDYATRLFGEMHDLGPTYQK